MILQGYQMKQAYIQTQMPLPHTIPDIWRLCYDHKSASIVMLNHLQETGEEDEVFVFCFVLFDSKWCCKKTVHKNISTFIKSYYGIILIKIIFSQYIIGLLIVDSLLICQFIIGQW